MATLVSSWYQNLDSIPEDYIFPPDKRPENYTCSYKTNPVIDLGSLAADRVATIQQLMKASQDVGFFQVVNHGVGETLMSDTMDVCLDFFRMPAQVKAEYYSVDPNSRCRLYTSTYLYETEEIHFWKDTLTHSCHPLEESMPFWPHNPPRYREIGGKYAREARQLVMKILELICEGLGLEKGYFDEELSQVQLMSINHYPPCPDPNLAMGIHPHCDPNLITILHQGDVQGLEVLLEDTGEWLSVQPIPNAFVVIIGCQLRVISNEKMKSAEHRAVTNSVKARTSVGTFILPKPDCYIEPARKLLNPNSPPRYKGYQYKEFLSIYGAKAGDYRLVLEHFSLKSDD